MAGIQDRRSADENCRHIDLRGITERFALAGAQTSALTDLKAGKPLSIEDVWKRPAIAEPVLSPNGRLCRAVADQ